MASDAHRQLELLVGTWKGLETVYPSPWDPDGGPATATVHARLMLDGHFVLTEYAEDRQGRSAYAGLGVTGYDESLGLYTLHWFDSAGGSYGVPALGTWHGNHLMFEQRSPSGAIRLGYNFRGDNEYLFQVDRSPDGHEYRPFLKGTYIRQR